MKTIFKTKQMALDMFELCRKQFLELARAEAVKICKEKGFVTTDDIRERIELPKGIDGRVCGAIFNRKEWEKIGYTQTRIRTSHSRSISIFKLI